MTNDRMTMILTFSPISGLSIDHLQPTTLLCLSTSAKFQFTFRNSTPHAITMDDPETQDSSSLVPAKARDGSSSLPKMHSLVQCGTEKYWEVDPSGENWIRFIKSAAGPLYCESQTTTIHGEEGHESSHASRMLPSIGSTEPQHASSDGGSSKQEMIIQLEVCLVTGIGHLLAVKAMEDSHGALFSIQKGSRTKLARRKLHLMRPGDKLCYVQNGDELVLEYRCETVIETSNIQSISRESFSNVDHSQESDILETQQNVPKSHEALYLTQEIDDECPHSETLVMQESGVLSKVDPQVEQKEHKGILSQASSSSDITIDPNEGNVKLLPLNASPVADPAVKCQRESPPESGVTVEAEIEEGEVPVDEESLGLFAPTQPSDISPAATNDQKIKKPQLVDCTSPTETQLVRQRRRKRLLEASSGCDDTGKEMISCDRQETKSERMTRSKTSPLGKPPRGGGKIFEMPRILITGYEVDSIIEEVGSMIAICFKPWFLIQNELGTSS